MGVFLVYMLKSSVCLALFYLFYRLLLSKETFHRFNRWVLLSLLVLSCAVPLIEVTVQEPSEMSQPFLALEEMVVMEPVVALDETPMYFPWKELMLLAYIGGILFFLVRHMWSLGRMVCLLRTSRMENLEGGILLFVHKEKVAPFSWMKMIAVSEEDLKENGKAILTHERAHIHNCHSWDLLLAEGCIFFQWFNPAAWLLKQELQTIHEYEADEWVIENGIDAKTYQLLIIKKAVGARLYSIANSFNHSSLKKRITMMIKKKSNPWARLKYLYVLPLAAVTVAAFARPEVSNKLDEISNTKINDLVSVTETFVQENKDTLHKVQYFEVKAVSENAPTKLNVRVEEGKKPLLIVDGAPWPLISLDNINAEMVESVTVLKGKEAVDLYGEKAKDGAVVIVSKRSQETIENENKKNNVPMRIAFTQEALKVSGTVLAADTKIPVMGASVIIRGTTNGTLTDHDGKFTLGGLRKGDVIRVSFVGFQTRSVIVKDESPLTIMLDDAVQNLEGMVVYAPTQKSEKDEVVVFDMPMEEVKQKEVKDEPIFQVVEEMPEFPGGMAEAMKFLAKNINYPVAAQQAKIEGRVIVQFVVEKDGSVSDLKVMSGVSPELDAEAIRVVSMMPKWIPGKQRGKAVAVKYTMPIMFRLQTPKPDKEETASLQQINLKVDKDVSSENVAMVKDVLREGYREMIMEFPQGVNKSVEKLPSGGVRYHSDHRITMCVENGKSPLIIVDGKEMGEGLDIMKEIPVNQIETVSLMKDKDAIAKYGEKAKNGVIEIETKKNKK